MSSMMADGAGHVINHPPEPSEHYRKPQISLDKTLVPHN